MADETPEQTATTKTYDQAYVTRLRNEIAENRTAAEKLAAERDELRAFRENKEREEAERKGEYEKVIAKEREEKAALEKRFKDELSARDRRLILSEAKAAAVKAGMIDPSDVSAIDLADLRIAEDGSVSGIAEKIADLKASKPHWFKGEKSEPKPRAGSSPGAGSTPSGEGSTDWAKLSADQFKERLDKMLSI